MAILNPNSCFCPENESPRFSSPIEWWFIHGRYGVGRKPQNYFMAAIFRNNLSKNLCRSQDGFSLLVSTLHADTGKTKFLSQVDSRTLNMLRAFDGMSDHSQFESVFINAYKNEVLSFGPPKPIRLSKDKVVLSSNPLKISWGNFALKQSKSDFKIQFKHPEIGLRCKFTLRSNSPRLCVDQRNSGLSDPMAYATYPSMKLTGKAGRKNVTGSAWLDHQWGNHKGWFFDHSKKKLLGWDWFGMNLSDNSDIIVMIHRDPKSMQPVGQFACVRREGKTSVYKKFKAKPLRHWHHPSRNIKYPVDWQICIPQIQANLIVKTLSDDQEIPVLGFMRTVWEGAGCVSGRMGHKNITGSARIELYGYGFLGNFQKHIDEEIMRIHQDVKTFFPKKSVLLDHQVLRLFFEHF